MERCPGLGSSQLKAATASCRHLASLSGGAPSNGRAPWAVAQASLPLAEMGDGGGGGGVGVRAGLAVHPLGFGGGWGGGGSLLHKADHTRML